MTDKGNSQRSPSETLVIRGKNIPVNTQFVEQSKLEFFRDNPRIYSVVHEGGKGPTQEDIETRLQAMDHVKQLFTDIKENGGLIDPLIIRQIRPGIYEVIEGNSRLAAYRLLCQKDAVKWSKVKCTILPDSIDDQDVMFLLGQYHLKGKKEWPPYEQAGFLHRLHKLQGVGKTELAERMALKTGQVTHLVETYDFMLKHKDNRVDHWSYYDEYLKSRTIQKARDNYPDLDKVIVEKIKSNEIERAQKIRDELPVICASEKSLKSLVVGKSTFDKSFDQADRGGYNDNDYKRLKKFRDWIGCNETQDALISTEGPIRAKIVFEVKQLNNILKGLKDGIEKDK
jgi:hypothetical protein